MEDQTYALAVDLQEGRRFVARWRQGERAISLETWAGLPVTGPVLVRPLDIDMLIELLITLSHFEGPGLEVQD